MSIAPHRRTLLSNNLKRVWKTTDEYERDRAQRKALQDTPMDEQIMYFESDTDLNPEEQYTQGVWVDDVLQDTYWRWDPDQSLVLTSHPRPSGMTRSSLSSFSSRQVFSQGAQ